MVPIERWLAEAPQHRLRTGRPLVTLSYAQSLDGSIAVHRGVPVRLSGEESMELTHRLRAAHDAILVGIGTVLADNPRLTVRLAEGEDPQPVILDSKLRTPLDANLLHGDIHPWIAYCQPESAHGEAQPYQLERARALEERGARLLSLPPDTCGRPSLPALLECLAEQGVNSLMVEGGARVITGFVTGNLVDQVVLTIAPLFLGGLPAIDRAPQVPADDQPEMLARLQEMGCESFGGDLVVWGRLH